MYVDPVEQRSRYFIQITLHGSGGTDTLFIGVIMKTAWTGIHGCYQHEAGRIIHTETGAGNGNPAVLQWLSHNLKYIPVKFRQLIEKKYAVMRQADFPRLWVRTSSHHGHVTNSMMRRTKRSLGHQRLMQPDLTCYAVYAGSLQCFIQRKRRKNRRHTLGHHGLARSGRPHHDNVVSPGSSHLKRTLHIFLPFHVGEIRIKSITPFLKFTHNVYHSGCRQLPSVKKVDDLTDVLHAIYCQTFYHSRFFRIGRRHDKSPESVFLCHDGYRQSSPERKDAAIE